MADSGGLSEPGKQKRRLFPDDIEGLCSSEVSHVSVCERCASLAACGDRDSGKRKLAALTPCSPGPAPGARQVYGATFPGSFTP